MKIYEIATGYTPVPARMGAATEIVAEELTRALLAKGADVTLVDVFDPNRKPCGLPLVQVPLPGFLSGTDVKLGLMHKVRRVAYSVALAMTLRGILQASPEPVVLHFHNQYNLFFFWKLVGPKLRKKARIAYTVHSYIWNGSWESIRDTIRKRYFQEVFCIQNADDVLVLNEPTAAHFCMHLGVAPERIHIVRNGVNPHTYCPCAPSETQAFLEKQGLGNQRILFQPGSVCRRKNQLGAVKRLCNDLKRHPDWVYVYAGGIIEPDYFDRITRFAAENGISGQVRYVGELSPGNEMNRWYNAASLTLFPSEQESFGLVIVESLAAGTPVLVQNAPDFPLETGWHLWESADTVERLMAQTPMRGQLRDAARPYNWETVAGQHLDIWEGRGL